MSYIPLPKPSYLDKCFSMGFIYGEKRWRDAKFKRIYTWDSLHGEIEIFNNRGRHLGVLDPITGIQIKDAVRGRRIDV